MRQKGDLEQVLFNFSLIGCKYYMQMYTFYKYSSTFLEFQYPSISIQRGIIPSLIIIIMICKVIIYLALLGLLQAVNEPILVLPITQTSSRQLQSTFSLGRSQVRVQLDISYKNIDVCCKNKETLLAKIYYFMLNPFRLNQDYRCKDGVNLITEDIAKFSKIGPLTVPFKQMVFPQCTIGKLGFSKSAVFLGLLPKNDQFFIIEKENSESKSKRLNLRVGGQYNQNFVLFENTTQSLWAVEIEEVSFNEISLGKQTIAIVTDKYEMKIPYQAFRLIRSELLRNFECIQQGQAIFCPCNEGVSHSFPTLKLRSSKIAVEIEPRSYLMDYDEICKGVFRSTSDAFWSVNVLMLSNVDLMFEYDSGRVGMALHRMSMQTSDSINQPLQIILNSIVILLMCLFVAMILIEVIKHVTGIQSVGTQSFENYMLKHAEE